MLVTDSIYINLYSVSKRPTYHVSLSAGAGTFSKHGALNCHLEPRIGPKCTALHDESKDGNEDVLSQTHLRYATFKMTESKSRPTFQNKL